MKRLLFAAAMFACMASTATAQVAPLDLAVGTQGDFLALEDDSSLANDGAWFIFTLDATTSIDIDINRSTADPDLIGSLFEGNVTGVDFGALTADDVQTSGFGPLTFIAVEDDTEDDPFGGPFGDPRFTNTLDAGTYSFLVASLNVDGPFSVTSNVGVVPEPSSIAVIGLCGLFATRRRR